MGTTIAAISTPRAVGGISVIRISGPETFAVCDRVFRPLSRDGLPSDMEGYTCAYGKILDGEEVLDDGVLTVFRAPKSYTGEDVAEISCHGGIFVTERVLRVVLQNGASPAGPGEFSKRAFLNGKMSLTQAEAVMDVISAEGEAGLRCAESLREGALYRRIKKISDRILELLADLAAWVDYPDDDIPAVTEEEISAALESAIADLDGLLAGYGQGKIAREGIDTAIVGRPNVGKSTLMNLLAGCDRSIVTDIAGTTRDVVEESVRLGDMVLRLADTAGLRDTADAVESVGVERAKKRLEDAELVLAVFDLGEEITTDDQALAELCRDRRAIAVLNKSDLVRRFDFENIADCFMWNITISAGSGEGAEDLSAAVMQVCGLGIFSPDGDVLANERQKGCALSAKRAFEEALSSLRSGATFDAVTILIDEGENFLLELSGERVSRAVVEQVFSRFCLGK